MNTYCDKDGYYWLGKKIPLYPSKKVWLSPWKPEHFFRLFLHSTKKKFLSFNLVKKNTSLVPLQSLRAGHTPVTVASPSFFLQHKVHIFSAGCSHLGWVIWQKPQLVVANRLMSPAEHSLGWHTGPFIRCNLQHMRMHGASCGSVGVTVKNKKRVASSSGCLLAWKVRCWVPLTILLEKVWRSVPTWTQISYSQSRSHWK